MATVVGEIIYRLSVDTLGLINGLAQADQRARRTTDTLNRTGEAVERTRNQMGRFGGTLTRIASAVASLAAATYLIAQSDAYTKMQAQLKLATTGMDQFYKAQSSVRSIAAESQSDLSSISTLYARISTATKDMGASQRLVGEITRTVALSMKVSGASAAEASSAMLQLSQSFASGVLRGEEFNAVSEAAPRLMKALADGMNVPIGRLRSMANEGKLTSDILAKALPKSLAQLEEEAKTIQTIGGAFQKLRNEVMLFIGSQMESSGAARMTASTVAALADKVGELGGSMETFYKMAKTGAMAFASVLAGRFVGSIAASTSALLAQVAATRLASEQELIRLNQLRVIAVAEASNAAAVRLSAVATADAAAVDLVAVRAKVALLTVDAQLAVAAAATAAGTSAAAATTAAATAATAALTAAKVAETQASAALVAGEARLAAARAAEATAAAAATAATTALATAQRAQTLSAGLAAAASRTFGAVMAALGGPIGVAIIAIAALAWKWGTLKTAGEEAAEAQEKAAAKIQRALSGAAAHPMRDLMNVRDDAEAELKRIDELIAKRERAANSRGRFGTKGPKLDLSDLMAQREAQRSIWLDASKAYDDYKEKTRQEIHAEIDRKEDDLKAPPKTKEQEGKTLGAKAYYEDLVAENATALARINAQERKALTENQKKMVEDAANAEYYEKAKGEIHKKYARERGILNEKGTQESADLAISMTIDEVEQIQAIRKEGIRRADAEVKLGVKTAAEGARAKAKAEFDAQAAMTALAERDERARAEARIAITKSQEERIALTHAESVRKAEAEYRRGAMTFAEAEAAKTLAAKEAADQRQALEATRTNVRLGTLQIQAGDGGIQSQEALIRGQAEAAKAEVERARQLDLEASQLYADQKVAIEADMNRRIAEMRANAVTSALTSTADGFGAITAALKNSAGEQSGVYKAMFAAQKAFSIASSIVAIQSGLAQASANPWPKNLAAMGSVLAATASIITTIKGTNYGGGRQYGGPVSAGSMYRVNETGRPEMFTASNGSQYMLPTANGSVTPAGQVAGGGAGDWKVIINNYGNPANASVQRIDENSRTVEITIGEISRQFRENSGPAWNGLQAGSNIQPRM